MHSPTDRPLELSVVSCQLPEDGRDDLIETTTGFLDIRPEVARYGPPAGLFFFEYEDPPQLAMDFFLRDV
jgi:hypothetical protein